jgi:hypothetical protein
MLVGLGVSACGSDSSSSSASAPQIATDAPNDVAQESTTAGGDSLATSDATATALEQVSGRALATTAGVTVATPDIRRAVDDTLTSIERNNASVYTADVNIGNEGDDGSVDGSGYFVVKVPPADLEPLINDLGATVGTVSGRTQETADVTDQLVDLDIRIGVERDVIARFQTLLTQATAFQDIVDIEQVISERTIALEQLLASQRALDNRVDLSTLTIQLQYEAPAVEPTMSSGHTISDAWRAGWDVFVGMLFAIGLALAVAAPFLFTAALLLGVIWLASRRIGRRRATPPPTPAPVSERDEELAAPTREG